MNYFHCSTITPSISCLTSLYINHRWYKHKIKLLLGPFMGSLQGPSGWNVSHFWSIKPMFTMPKSYFYIFFWVSHVGSITNPPKSSPGEAHLTQMSTGHVGRQLGNKERTKLCLHLSDWIINTFHNMSKPQWIISIRLLVSSALHQSTTNLRPLFKPNITSSGSFVRVRAVAHIQQTHVLFITQSI